MTAIGLDRRVHGAAGATGLDDSGHGLAARPGRAQPVRPGCGCPGRRWSSRAHAFFVVHLLGATPLGLARLAASGYAMVVHPGRLRRAAADLAHPRRRWRCAAPRWPAGRRRNAPRPPRSTRTGADRLALLEVEALPLLRGIADGTLDPADPRGPAEVRPSTPRRCGGALVRPDRPGGGLLAGLEPALRAARARGLPVEVQVVGDPGQPGREVAQATLAAVDAVLRALPPQPVDAHRAGVRGRGGAVPDLRLAPATWARCELTWPGWASRCRPPRAGTRVDADGPAGLPEVRWRQAGA